MYSAAFLKEKLPFETGKHYKNARQKIWKKIEKSLPNYIKLKEAKIFIKTTIQINFKYDQKQEEDQIIAGYNYAKNLLTPLTESDRKFAEQTVSKSEFKYFLRHMRLYYETLFAWKKFQSHDEKTISVDKLRKVVDKMKTWGHLYLNGWDAEKIHECFGEDGAFSLKNFTKFVFSVATKFEYNAEGEQNLGEHAEHENTEHDEKSLTSRSRSEIDRSERNSMRSEQLIDFTKVEREEKDESGIENGQKPVTYLSQQMIYTESQQQQFYSVSNQKQDLHQERIKYSYIDLFQMAKDCFYARDYEEGLNFINECILIDPKNSILYSNRALFYTQIELVDYAFADFFSALELNHLNYIAYFNMFSILTRLKRHQEAFENLSCALSCLYLIRAKSIKSEIDATKAIKYAQNNVEAHLLKAMMHLENGKIKIALNELNWACELNPRLKVLKSVRSYVVQQLSPEEQLDFCSEINDEGEDVFIRLEGSYQIEEESERQREVEEKVQEFNKLYNDLKGLGTQMKIFSKTAVIEQTLYESEINKHSSKDIGTMETLQAEVDLLEN